MIPLEVAEDGRGKQKKMQSAGTHSLITIGGIKDKHYIIIVKLWSKSWLLSNSLVKYDVIRFMISGFVRLLAP